MAVAVFALAAAAPVELRPLRAKKLAAPMPGVSDWCERWARPHLEAAKRFDAHCEALPSTRADTECADPPGYPECDRTSGLASGAATAEAPPAPWRSVRVFATREGVYRPLKCNLALETGRGVFVRAGVSDCGPYSETGDLWSVTSDSFRFESVKGARSPVLVWRFVATNEEIKRVTAILVCGVGPSGTPSCESFALERAPWDAAGRTYRPEWTLEARFDDAGRLVMSLAAGGAPLGPGDAARAGTFALTFP